MSCRRRDNFSAGPAALPAAVLEQLQRECLDWQGHGFAAFEFSHRHKDFLALSRRAADDLRLLLGISSEYSVLFLQGGATLQFSTVPLNLLANNRQWASYAVTGSWSKKAAEHAVAYCQVHYSHNQPNATVMRPHHWSVHPQSHYLHYCINETISGLECYDLPQTTVPLVADASSTLLSRPFDISPFGLVYAGAQKNIGPAGLTIVIVRNSLLAKTAQQALPPTQSYRLQQQADSMLNTPPTFAIYVAGLVFHWLLTQGGLAAVAALNRQKATLLYDIIDASDLYHNQIDPLQRSWMNVTFTIANQTLLAAFLAEAEANGFFGLKGHKLVGGVRASIYNAVPLAAVERLADFMRAFEKTHG